MTPLDVKLIALDLDDTLLNDDREITNLNVQALRDCAQKGIFFHIFKNTCKITNKSQNFPKKSVYIFYKPIKMCTFA